MEYIIQPMSTSDLTGECSCGVNYSEINNCEENIEVCITDTCTANCGTLAICITPSGAKQIPGI